MTMSKTTLRPPAGLTEAEEAEWWYAHRDQTDEIFTEDTEPVAVRRDVTMSVRFSTDEMAELRAYADKLGVKVTTLIRTAVLEEMHHATRPMDRAAIVQLVADLEQRTHELVDLVAPR